MYVGNWITQTTLPPCGLECGIIQEKKNLQKVLFDWKYILHKSEIRRSLIKCYVLNAYAYQFMLIPPSFKRSIDGEGGDNR